MNATIVLLPGDGIGPEVVREARSVLEVVARRFGHRFTFTEHLIGGASIDAHGTALADDALAACRASDAVLLGAVGGPAWSDPNAKVRPEQGLLGLRKALGLWANLRPVRPIPELADCSPLRPERLAGVDLLVVRELTGGLYFGPRVSDVVDGRRRAFDTLEYTEHEIARVVTLAFELARERQGRVTSIDKANVLESSRLWRQIAIEVGQRHPDVALDHQLVDSAAMRLITAPASFDVIVTENMFGDILTDEAAILAGSLGLCPSASLGHGPRGLYEPIHGSAPDIAGKGIANPIGTILSAAMLLRHSLRLEAEARAIEYAVAATIASGARTADIAAPGSKDAVASTAEMGARIRDYLGKVEVEAVEEESA
ncbi:3-isopropylmalate dehydrogenase [Pendulispora albinea]|uniref:3-isopropylmalate dehydrogenase n=1 Tax=Pendulispora albinea TaxID=2741071 RepID=A0ABZ2M1V8_9BACT